MSVRSRRASTIALIIFLILCYGRFSVGSMITATSVDNWYQTLNKASFNPPDWIFSPIWVVLYFLMAIAGWRVWLKNKSRAGRYALVLFAIQLVLNLAWSVLFFGYQQIGFALVEMSVLLATVILTGLHFSRIDRLAGLLFLPYAIWLIFALVLNTYIFVLN